MMRLKKIRKKKSIFLAILLTAASLMPRYAYAEEQNPRDNKIKYHELSYEDELAEAKEKLDLGDISNVTKNLVLAHSYGVHIKIEWKSSDETLIDTEGKVVNPTEEEKTVTLTAKLTSSMTDKTESAVFEVTLPKMSPEELLENDSRIVQEYVDYIVNTGYQLPDADELGIRSALSWELTAGNAEIKNGRLFKTKDAKERQPVTLKAVLTYEDKTKETELSQIVLLDEYTAYILSYFAGVNESKEMYIGYSFDGTHWMRLNEGNAVLKPRKGNKQIRDPYIMRKKDGSFAVFATNGWNSDAVTVWDSGDLAVFENERLLKVTQKEYKGLSGRYAWAPECNYDPVTELYYIYWSDPDTGKTWYNTSLDLLDASMPDVFYEANTNMIDASIKKYKGDYYMVYNDAYGNNEGLDGGRMIYGAKADSLEAGAFHPYWGTLSEPIAEGPFLLYDFKKDRWTVYYDYYSKHKFGVNTIKNINDDNWEYKGISETMPSEELRHGGAIPVTQKELDRIIEAWGKEEPDILSLEKIPQITIKVGDKEYLKKLPKTVPALLGDGSRAELAVQWDTEHFSNNEECVQKLTGVLKDTTYANASGLKAEAEVKVVKSGNLLFLILLGTAAVILIAGAVVLVRFQRKK